jgi:hypothetical protein
MTAADCKMSARITTPQCKAYKSSGSLSCVGCPGLDSAGDCLSCATLQARLDIVTRREKDILQERDNAVDLATRVRLERDALRREIEALKKTPPPVEREGIVLRFTGDNEAVIRKLMESCEKEKTDAADDICSLIDVLASGEMRLVAVK